MKTRDQLGLVLAAGAALAVVPLFLSGGHTRELSTVAAYTVAILGLDLLVGACGRMSFGQGAFMAVGGYTTAILCGRHGVGVFWTIPLAGAAGGGAGLALGLPALRMRGRALELAAFAAAVAVPPLALHFDGFTGGAAGTAVEHHSPGVVYAAGWGVAAALFLAAWALTGSRFALKLRAARDNDTAAAAAGLNRGGGRLAAFTVAGAYGGAAGALLVVSAGHADPGMFPLRLSLLLLAAAVIGGLGSIWGAVATALLIRYLGDVIGALPHVGVHRAGPVSFVIGLFLVAVAVTHGLSAAVARARHAPPRE